MSENQLALLDTNIDARTLAQLTGAPGAFSVSSSFARVRINTDYEVEDEEGNAFSVPPGSFAVKDEEGVEIYAKTAILRPLVNRFQYRRYDPEADNGKGSTVARTIMVAALGWGGEEPLDDQGGISCGKISNKEAKKGGLSAAQMKIQKDTSAYRYVYGYLTMDGVSKEGEKVSLVDYPVCFRMRGVNFMPFDEVQEKIKKRNGSMQAYPLTMTLKKDRNGDTVFFRIEYTFDPKSPVPLTAEVLGTIKEVLAEVEDHNADILGKWKKARKGASRPAANDNDGTPLGDDFYEQDAA